MVHTAEGCGRIHFIGNSNPIELKEPIYTDEDLKWYTQPKAVVLLIHLSVSVIPLNEIKGS